MPGPQIRVRNWKLFYFYYFSTKTYVVGTQKNRLNETVLFEHPKHMFKQMDKKIITILRWNFLFNWTYEMLKNFEH